VNVTAVQTSASSTPILDRLAPMPGTRQKKHHPFARLIGNFLLIVFVLGAPIALIALRPPFEQAFFRWAGWNFKLLFGDDWAGVRIILTGFAIALVVLTAIATHECGHFLVGLAVGFRFRSLHVWRLQIDGKLQMSRYKPSEGEVYGGTLFFPKEMRNRPLSVACMTLAGPLANLLSGYLLFILPFDKSFISGSYILASFFFGLENLVPFRSGPIISDGMHLFTLLRDRAKYERRLSLAQILEDRLAGVEAESLSPELLASAIAVRDESLETLLAHLIAYAAARSQQKDEEAAQLLETSLQYSSYATSSLREALMADAAIFQAAKKKRVDLAEKWLAALPARLEVPYRRLMVEGSILEAQENYAGALQKVDEIEKTILSATEPARQQTTLKPFAKWRAELEQKAAPATAHPAL
jgi:hypothetical protein